MVCYPIWYHNCRITSVERGSLTCFEEEKLCVDSRANVSSSPAARTGSARRRSFALCGRRGGDRANHVNGSAAEAASQHIAIETGAAIYPFAADVSVKADDQATVRVALEKMGGWTSW